MKEEGEWDIWKYTIAGFEDGERITSQGMQVP